MHPNERVEREVIRESSPRSFGFVFAFVFGLIALVPLSKGDSVRPLPLAISALFLFCALLKPHWLAWPNRLWFRFGMLLHRVTQPIFLGILFYLIFTPMGWVIRRFQGDLLHRRWEPSQETYWITRTQPTAESMKRVF